MSEHAGVTAPDAPFHYQRHQGKRTQWVAFGAALLLGIFLLDMTIGPGQLGLGQVLNTLLSPDEAGIKSRFIVWDIRLPVALMAILVGAALGGAGALMQTILNNPLAEPFTLGVSHAAAFGAALAIAFGTSLLPWEWAQGYIITLNAFVFACLSALVIFLVSRMRGATQETMILTGIAILFVFSALNAMLQFAASAETLQQIVFWAMGSLGRATWPKVGVAAALLALACALLWRSAWRLTALRMGDEAAEAMGVNVTRIRLVVLMLSSLLAAVAVAFVGIIGFVGLVGPHMARMLLGEDQRFFLPGSMLFGAILLTVAEILSKTIIPGVLLPIGITTSLIGVPFFVFLLVVVRRRSAA
ncbi:FecCD family ABC transporter permease [Oceanimonas marisflavi]|uniref:FecCD family ABC transporter permease n=1 Tax=Oceanimonas marisflavi TaxID=2059724 RepID=UPI000D320D75|nr:iron ABC transporter permease [Oceanimonas marisflavi]